ncbi:hypothetical protein BK660_21800 [Pseudomonas brassicacearum]|uniref:Uncharacterized protein n=1 Tax=Pseudomonas brassicacearum TaxID=930166 RepID=A0A423HXN9_9PSED|nr:hypothetical protein [Pseudomonas brassicacearum]RON17927.1 hypothetical protein BK660_21800 [Pseudomonas brassicacearum]
MSNQFYLAVTAAILFGFWGGYMFGFGRSKLMAAENILLNEEIDRLIEEFDKAWRHDLNDKNNVQVLAAEVARLAAQHNDLVLRNKVLRERPDLPVERIQCHDQVMAVQAASETLRKDAERYRFLREWYVFGDLRVSAVLVNLRTGMSTLMDGALADATIDGYMSQEPTHD